MTDVKGADIRQLLEQICAMRKAGRGVTHSRKETAKKKARPACWCGACFFPHHFPQNLSDHPVEKTAMHTAPDSTISFRNYLTILIACNRRYYTAK